MSSNKKSDTTENNISDLFNNIDFGEIFKKLDFTQISSLMSSFNKSSQGDEKKVLENIDEQKIKDIFNKLSSINLNELFNTENITSAKDKFQNVLNGEVNDEVKEKLKAIKSKDINEIITDFNDKLTNLKKGTDNK